MAELYGDDLGHMLVFGNFMHQFGTQLGKVEAISQGKQYDLLLIDRDSGFPGEVQTAI
ncbi:MAG: hypothetical protein ACREV2_02825 [Burkholderiales bacterium]